MSDEKQGSESRDPAEDIVAALGGPGDPQVTEAEQNRIAVERADAARRLAEARRQIARADSGSAVNDPAEEDLYADEDEFEYADEDDLIDEPEPEPSYSSGDSGRSARLAQSKGDLSGFSTNTDFRPRRSTRNILALILLVLIAASLYTLWAVIEVQNAITAVAAGVTVAATLAVWAIRVNTPLVMVSIRGGMLVVKRGGDRQVFDLSTEHAPIRIEGTPGKRGWKVLLRRTDGLPAQLTSAEVRPHEFMEKVLRIRPELAD